MRKISYYFLLLFCLLFCHAEKMLAIKANPRPVTVKQPDGTSVTVRIHGDENFHYTTTLDGYLIKRDKDGFFKYVNFDAEKKFQNISVQKVSNADQRSEAEIKFLSNLSPVRKYQSELLNSRSNLRKAPEKILSKKITSPVQPIENGGKESQYLVILVNFKDKAFHFESSDFDRWLNEKGYSVDGGTGSVKDYYRDNSMGKFIPNFTVAGPYTLAHPQVYYAANSEDGSGDINPREMVIEACNMAKTENPSLNFASFDNDKDGYMDNVYIIYAGYSEASTGNENDMWPHSWTLGEQTIQVDGITVKNYSCSAELVGASGTKMDGIGTFTHEFGHILGLKDMYDTDEYLNGYGLDPGEYSLFASGSYNNDSRTPPYLMAFERLQMGWCEPTELKDPEDVALLPISENTARYINAQPNRAEGTGYEWFILENRQNKGWDAYLPAHGLLIYHYDYTQEMVEKYWSINGPNNNAKHRCLYIKPADGIDDINTRNGDTYPGRSGNTEFTDTSMPNSLNWNGEKTNTPITNIREEGGIIYFQVKGGIEQLAVLKTELPQNIRDTSVDVAATLVNKTQNVSEMGFCWALKQEPTLESSHRKVEVSDRITYTITGLEPGSYYNVRGYMILEDGSVVYGAAIPFMTECALAVAPYIANFSSWTNGEPDCWKIIDNNSDGTTWIFDDTTQGMLYQFDYWNKADDWLISTRMLVPENGSLFFIRGVVESTAIEKLDIYVSTDSRNIEDFHLVKRFTFADNFSEQVAEEVSLKEYEGKEIYLAFVCHSDKLQGNLWLWQIYLASSLEAPTITKFDKSDDGLYVEWMPVKGATTYFLEFDEVTEEVLTSSVFVPESFYERVEGKVEIGTGSIIFTGDGVVETCDFPDGLTDCLFILTSSGPVGTSILTLEGTENGTDWEQIGPVNKISQYDAEGTENFMQQYMKEKKYRRMRITCQFGGRNLNLKYFTLAYNDGKVWKALSAGAVNNTFINIKEKTQGEFLTGKTYATRVYAGDGILFYNSSEPAYFTYQDTGFDRVIPQGKEYIYSEGNIVYATGLTRGDRLVCTTPAGLTIYDSLITDTKCTFTVNGYEGILIVRLIGKEERKAIKLIVKH